MISLDPQEWCDWDRSGNSYDGYTITICLFGFLLNIGIGKRG